MEALWLLTVVLVPLAFLDPDYVFSEAEIAFVEIPKIAILRTLVGLMAVLWLIEWGISGRFPLERWFKRRDPMPRPSTHWSQPLVWLREQPTRWLILAVWFFLLSTLVSTVFSASVKVSLWGEIPGQDGLNTYTMVAHLLLFGVITAHLKTPSQLWRLLSAIVVTGVLLASIAITQHYGSPYFEILDFSAIGGARVTSTLGNAVFAGAAMLIPISISLLLATVSLQRLSAVKHLASPLRSPMVNLLALAAWVLVLTVQFLGIIFTFSRGPWLGTLLALSGFLLLSLLFVGWRSFGRASLILGWSALLTWVIIQWSGSGVNANIGLWVWVPLTMAVGLTIAATLRHSLPLGSTSQRLEAWSGHFGLSGSVRARLMSVLIMAVGVAAAMAFGVFVVFPFTDRTSPAPDEGSPAATPSSIDVTGRFTSITGSVLSGGLSNRVNIWKGSLVLMRDHPWFDFDDLSLPWLRPLVGYGPDMFRYTYLLVSVPLDASFLPAEPDHAHNFFLNQGVEQGLLGLLSSFGIFLAVFCIAAVQLIGKSKGYSDLHKLVLVGLLATVAGRFLEQTVGVTRVSDLMLFWVVLAVFAALPVAMQSQERAPEPAPPPAGRAPRGRTSRASRERNTLDLQMVFRLMLVAWAVGGIAAVTWVKTVNYPRAAIAASESIDQFRSGDYQSALNSLDQATRLAPDVPVYHSSKSSVYIGYLRNPQVPQNLECSLELNGVPYQDCLAQNIHLNNIIGTEQRPLYWRSRLSQANSALALGLEDEAIRLYREVVDLVPGAWRLHNRLAEAYIDIGQPEAALKVLQGSIAITKDSYLTDFAAELQVLARSKLGTSLESLPDAESN